MRVVAKTSDGSESAARRGARLRWVERPLLGEFRWLTVVGANVAACMGLVRNPHAHPAAKVFTQPLVEDGIRVPRSLRMPWRQPTRSGTCADCGPPRRAPGPANPPSCASTSRFCDHLPVQTCRWSQKWEVVAGWSGAPCRIRTDDPRFTRAKRAREVADGAPNFRGIQRFMVTLGTARNRRALLGCGQSVGKATNSATRKARLSQWYRGRAGLMDS